MKRFDRMSLKELQNFHAINKEELRTRGGIVFPAGTRFEIRNKWAGLSLHEIGGDGKRQIVKVQYWKLEFVVAQQSVKRTATTLARCEHGIPTDHMCPQCGDQWPE